MQKSQLIVNNVPLTTVEKQKRFVIEGTFQSIEDCLKQIQ